MYYTLYAFLTIIIIIVVFQLTQSAIIKRALIGLANVLACAGKKGPYVWGDVYVDFNISQKGEYFSWSCHFWNMSKHYLEIQSSGYISYSFPIMTRYRLLYTIFMCCGWLFMSDVNKISSSRVNTTNKQGIKQLGIPFGSIFSSIFLRPSQGPRSYQPGEIPGPRLLITALSRFYTCGYCSYRSVSCCLNKVYV